MRKIQDMTIQHSEPATAATSATSAKKDKEQRAVQSIEVGGRLLMALANSPTPLTLRDLSSRSDLPPSRAHPYLVSFGKLGLIDNWLRHVQDVANTQDAALAGLEGAERVDRLCELNVVEQARHVCETTVIQDAWARGQVVHIHAWVYGLKDGRLRDLGFDSSNWINERIR